MSDKMLKQFNESMDQVWEQAGKPSTIAIAVSGGADSVALMMLIQQWCQSRAVLHALTVDHGLRSNSSEEADSVRRQIGLDNHHVLTIDWSGGVPQSDVENKARQKRYELMNAYCKKHAVPLLLIGHHADDQIETFLMNLARGSGVYGLAGMKQLSKRNTLFLGRPMLQISKEEILRYCQDNKRLFVEDPMNQDIQFTRVKLRKNRQLLSEKLGISDDRILLAISNLQRVRDFVEQEVDQLLIHSKVSEKIYRRPHFQNAHEEISLRALGRIVAELSVKDYPPELLSLQSLLKHVKLDQNFSLNLAGVFISGKVDQLIFQII